MTASQRIVQMCLFLIAAIAVSGGSLQMYLGQPAWGVLGALVSVLVALAVFAYWLGTTLGQPEIVGADRI